MAETQLIRRKCDWCESVQEFTKNPAQFTAAERVQSESWIVLVKVLFALGDAVGVQKHACTQSCAENIIKLTTFELPEHIKEAVKQEELRIAMMAAAAKNDTQTAEA